MPLSATHWRLACYDRLRISLGPPTGCLQGRHTLPRASRNRSSDNRSSSSSSSSTTNTTSPRRCRLARNPRRIRNSTSTALSTIRTSISTSSRISNMSTPHTPSSLPSSTPAVLLSSIQTTMPPSSSSLLFLPRSPMHPPMRPPRCGSLSRRISNRPRPLRDLSATPCRRRNPRLR